MRILAIETATPVASAAVLDAGGLLAESVLRTPMHHLEGLLPAVDAMLGRLGLAPEAIEGLAVSCGPGGFTGLRIGIAMTIGWAKARDLPAIGVGTLEALALVPNIAGLVLPVIDAHRGEVAGALYRIAPDGTVECLVPALVAPPEVVAAQAALHPGPVLVVGDGLVRHEGAMLSALGPRARAGGGELHPRAAAVGLLALPRLQRGERTDLDALRPLYGRRPVVWPGKETPPRGGNQR